METPRPFGLLAELTYRCPLRCPYCSNPTVYPEGRDLTTVEWERVIDEAAALGVLHIHFSGGEPLLRPDLEALVSASRAAGLYSNLITSAMGLSRERTERLRCAGLDSVQISFQSDEPDLADSIAGVRAHARKLEAARTVVEAGLPLSLNHVMHRSNIDRLERMVALAEDLQADRLELANTQFYGWGFQNRNALLPTFEQVERASRAATAAQLRLRGKIEIVYVLPDYYSDRPKPCMNGWGQRQMTVNPIGEVLPCPAASQIVGMRFESVREKTLGSIWSESEAFNQFRGEDWMPDPCRECDRRTVDFGGCRCQAFLLTGDAGATDPVCSLSPHHGRLIQLRDDAVTREPGATAMSFDYRINPGAITTLP